VSTGADELPLLRPVTRKRLVKANWEVLMFAAVISELWRSAVAL
jgi:hypothetical protein